MKRLSVFLGCLAALVALEILGHVFPSFFRFKPQRYSSAPNAELGYTCEWQKKASALSHVYGLAIGDSFTAGAPKIALQDMYPGVASRLLGKKMLNLGCQGYGTLQENILANKWLPRLAPQVLVLEVFPGNDWLDNYDFTYWLKFDQNIPLELFKKVVNDEMPYSRSALKIDSWLLGKSVVYTVIYNFLTAVGRIGEPPFAWYRDDPRAAAIGQNQAFAAILHLKKICARQKTRFLVVLVRTKPTLDQDNANDASTRKFLKTNKITCIDPGPELSEARRNGQKLFLPDGHWNKTAESIVGGLVARALRPYN